MFRIEQNIRQKGENRFKKAGFQTGTTLANKNTVKRKITYKEVTLAFGIVVAMLVALTIWATKNPAEESTTGSAILPYITSPATSKTLVTTVLEILF